MSNNSTEIDLCDVFLDTKENISHFIRSHMKPGDIVCDQRQEGVTYMCDKHNKLLKTAKKQRDYDIVISTYKNDIPPNTRYRMIPTKMEGVDLIKVYDVHQTEENPAAYDHLIRELQERQRERELKEQKELNEKIEKERELKEKDPKGYYLNFIKSMVFSIHKEKSIDLTNIHRYLQFADYKS